MVGNYGLFPRVLVALASVIAIVVALVSFASGFVSGLLMSALTLAVWTGLCRLILFGFESNVLSTYPNPKVKVEKDPDPVVSDDVYPPKVAEAMLRTLAGDTKEAKDRILQGANRSLVAQARIISQPASNRGTPSPSPQDATERREDQEWADMFRAL